MSSIWGLFAIGATLGWGLSYVFLPIPVAAHVNPFVTGTAFGLTMLVSNLVALVIESYRDGISFAEQWEPLHHLVVLGCVIAYSVSYTLAEFAYLLGARTTNISFLTAFTSCYPLVTILVSLPIYRDYTHLDIRFLIPGALLAVGGVVLLSFANKGDVA